MALHGTRLRYRFPVVQVLDSPFGIRACNCALFFAFLVALSSCLRVPVEKTLPHCPVPTQQCKPGTWQGNDFAGIPSYGQLQGEHRVDFVASVNSPDDELSLAFGNAKVAFLTVSGQGTTQRLLSASVTSALGVHINTELQAKGMVDFGTPALHERVALFAGVASTAYTGDADLYTYTPNSTRLDNIQRISDSISLPLVWDSHPTLSPNGSLLFFASNRPGGYGGTDIWYAVYKAGTWGKPHNCGPYVNTECDEITPFVTPDGKRLLFSSAGHETMGGYDLFSTVITPEFYAMAQRGDAAETALQAAQNLGAPINSASDELFPSTPAQFDTLLYFSSNRTAQVDTKNTGGFDLYVLHVVPLLPDTAQQRTRTTARTTTPTVTVNAPTTPTTTATLGERRVVAHGRVLHNNTHKPVEEANVTVRDVPTRTIIDQTRSDSAGRYTLRIPVERDVEIAAQGKHLFYDTKQVRIPKDDTSSILLPDFVLPNDLALRLNFPNDEYNNPYPYLLDSNGQATDQQWREALDLLAQNLTLYGPAIQRLILTGHTDDVADVAYNKVLGMRRAQFVVDELIQRGVPASKLEARSEGESRLLPRRKGEDLDTYRIRCRRVELTKQMIFILPNGK